ncbi:hypothetical protein ACTFIR_000695 [Dictyostelium discoideum]
MNNRNRTITIIKEYSLIFKLIRNDNIENQLIKILNDNEIGELFYNKIWKNKYLRKNISNQLLKGMVERIGENEKTFLDIKALNKYKNKNLLKSIIILDNMEPSTIKLPKSITKLSLPNFKRYLREGYFESESITELNLLGYNEQLSYGSIPNSVKTIRFSIFNQTIEQDCLPEQLETLEFGLLFNQPIVEYSIPQSLTLLKFGHSFNQSLENANLSATCITTLIFGNNFNQQIQIGQLPSQLKTLYFGNSWSQPIIAGSFGQSITDLTFSKFNHPISPGDLPCSLLKLTFKSNFNQNLLPNSIPNSVVDLFLGASFDKPLIEGSIPNSCTSLSITGIFNQMLQSDSIPKSITSLELGYCFDQSLENANLSSTSITSLILGDRYNQSINKGYLPNNLKYLKLGAEFNKPLIVGSMDSIKKLRLGYKFNQDIPINVIPLVESLELGSSFNKKLDTFIIPSVKSLTICNRLYDHIIQENDLPNVKELIFL